MVQHLSPTATSDLAETCDSPVIGVILTGTAWRRGSRLRRRRWSVAVLSRTVDPAPQREPETVSYCRYSTASPPGLRAVDLAERIFLLGKRTRPRPQHEPKSARMNFPGRSREDSGTYTLALSPASLRLRNLVVTAARLASSQSAIAFSSSRFARSPRTAALKPPASATVIRDL